MLGSFKTSKNLIKSLHRLLPLKNELDELQETLVTVSQVLASGTAVVGAGRWIGER